MDIKELNEKLGGYINEDIHNAQAVNIYHVEMDVAVEILNHIATEKMIERELNKIDGVEVQYIETEGCELRDDLGRIISQKSVKEDFNPEETKVPEEDDLDDIYDAIQTLNKCEWFVKDEKQVDLLTNVQNILQAILDENEE